MTAGSRSIQFMSGTCFYTGLKWLVMESRQCLRALMNRAFSWGDSRVNRVLDVWADLLSASLLPALRPGLSLIAESTAADRRADPVLRSWYVFFHVVHEPSVDQISVRCIPCECCGSLTGRWCEGCDDTDHAICGPCEDEGLVCVDCPGQSSDRATFQFGGMQIYAYAQDDAEHEEEGQ